jgi:hypothetical protein
MQAVQIRDSAIWLSLSEITAQLNITPRTLDWLIERGRVQGRLESGQRRFRLMVAEPFEEGDLSPPPPTPNGGSFAVAPGIRWRPMRMAFNGVEEDGVEAIRARIQAAKKEFEELYDKSEIPTLKI